MAHLVTVPLSDQLGDSEVLKAALLAVVFTVTAVGNKLSRVARPVWRWRPAGDSESEAILGPRQATAWPDRASWNRVTWCRDTTSTSLQLEHLAAWPLQW